jgi:hypothetical protein
LWNVHPATVHPSSAKAVSTLPRVNTVELNIKTAIYTSIMLVSMTVKEDGVKYTYISVAGVIYSEIYA